MTSTLGSPPPRQPDSTAQVPPVKMDPHELLRMGQASNRARLLYPGVVGEVLVAELDAARDMKWRPGTRVERLVHHLMTSPTPPS